MSRQRLPVHNSSPSPAPVLLVPGSGAGPSSGRASPYRPNSSSSQYSESPYGGGMSSGAGGGGMGGYSGTTQQVEGQNDERLSGLLGKVKSLKDITVGIGNEVRDGNLELAGMNDSFASTTNFLGGTFRRMTKMASRQGGNWCYFMAFLLLVLFIFVLLWLSRR